MHKYCRRKCFYIFYSCVYWCFCIEQACLSKLLGWYSVHSQDDLSSATFVRISVPTVVKRIQKVLYRLIERIVLHMWKSIGNQAGSTWTILQLWQRRRICRAFRLESLWAKCPANPPSFPKLQYCSFTSCLIEPMQLWASSKSSTGNLTASVPWGHSLFA